MGLDSMAVIELLYKIEETFNLQIPDQDLPGLTTVGAVADYVQCRLAPAKRASASAHQKTVITSYSIHYTKLYDWPIPLLLKNLGKKLPRLGIVGFGTDDCPKPLLCLNELSSLHVDLKLIRCGKGGCFRLRRIV